MVQNPGMETHIHPFEVYSKKNSSSIEKYLHTSPEFEMKAVLAQLPEFPNIYNISYCFRDEPESPHHRSQFLMLEWYRRDARYEKIMHDCELLIQQVSDALKANKIETHRIDHYERVTVQALFQEYLKFDILQFLNEQDLKEKITLDFKDVPLPDQECSWDDYFFLLFLNKIEPKLKKIPCLFLYEYPYQLAALSTLSSRDARVCERFEVYINGLEVANCFNELTDYRVQKDRFAKQAEEKSTLYRYQLPPPTQFLNILKQGFPQSAGIAMGVERLVQALTGISNPFFR